MRTNSASGGSCRPQAIVDPRETAESVVAHFQYTLNADGNKASAIETDDQNITRHFRWDYDALDRLTSEVLDSSDDSQDYITTYTMDLVSNRLAKNTDNAATAQAISDFVTLGSMTADEVVEYEYDANDRMQSEKKDAAGTAEDTYTTYAWNAGDQISKTTHAGLTDQGAVTETTTFEYNVQGRTGKITTVKAGVTTEITYKYNLQGIRVEEATTAGGVTTTKSYLIDQANLTGYAQVDGQSAQMFAGAHARGISESAHTCTSRALWAHCGCKWLVLLHSLAPTPMVTNDDLYL